MAGSHTVDLRMSQFKFEASAKPARLLSRIPGAGPFFTYNLGRNPRFVISVKYLGYAGWLQGDIPDPKILPNEGDRELATYDLYLLIDGRPVQGDGDDLKLDLDTSKLERQERQYYCTREWPLTRTGKAELKVDSTYEGLTLYSFEVKDTTVPLTTAILTIFGGAVGAVLTWLFSKVL